MREKINSAVGSTQELIGGLFSWMILASIAIIISGKLVVKRLPIGISDNALFTVPLYFFKIEAKGEEVSVGFLLFIITFGFSVIFGGKPAYAFFKDNSGIDIGQWNSLCAISSFFCLLISVTLTMLVPFVKSEPLISEAERDEVNNKLRGN